MEIIIYNKRDKIFKFSAFKTVAFLIIDIRYSDLSIWVMGWEIQQIKY